MKRIISSFLIGGLIFSGLFSQSAKDKLKISRDNTVKEIEYANKLLIETQGKTKESLNEIAIINHKLNKRKEYLLGVEIEVNMLSEVMEGNSDSATIIQLQIERLKKIYGKLIFNLYRNRSSNYRLMYFLASESMSQLYERVKMIRVYNRYLRNRRRMLQELQEKLLRKNQDLEILRSSKEELLISALRERDIIMREMREKKKMVTQLSKKQKEIEDQIREKQRTAQRLESELRRVIDEERKKIKSIGTKEYLTPEEKIISNDFEKNYGRLPWPTQRGIITGKYGEHQHPDYKSVIIRNDGIYITTTAGEDARSVFKGIISRVFTIPGENYTVIIKHGEYYTLYHNLINVNKKPGQNVNIKDVIGTVSTNGTTRETVLYFQVWKEKEKSDPELWLVHD
jgi:septal ring factor EnvC (AmiA/AmiB activator)